MNTTDALPAASISQVFVHEIDSGNILMCEPGCGLANYEGYEITVK